jgi:hypothetical protein
VLEYKGSEELQRILNWYFIVIWKDLVPRLYISSGSALDANSEAKSDLRPSEHSRRLQDGYAIEPSNHLFREGGFASRNETSALFARP